MSKLTFFSLIDLSFSLIDLSGLRVKPEITTPLDKVSKTETSPQPNDTVMIDRKALTILLIYMFRGYQRLQFTHWIKVKGDDKLGEDLIFTNFEALRKTKITKQTVDSLLKSLFPRYKVRGIVVRVSPNYVQITLTSVTKRR